MIGIILALILACLLWIPERRPPVPDGAGRIPFTWDRDDLWTQLEKRFTAARESGCENIQHEIDASLNAIDASLEAIDASLATLSSQSPGGDDKILMRLEEQLFELAPLVGACPQRVPELISLVTRIRAAVKELSWQWKAQGANPAAVESRNQLYRLLYGGRAAVEEVLLQLPRDQVPDLIRGTDEPSATPSVEYRGVRVHSGDLLVSRGGAPTSALIARGNDYPGNFSHIALLHIDETSSKVTIVEAQIEEGVVLKTFGEYLGGTQLRIMVLRPRSDLPALMADPLLPHRAATRALEEARRRHIPYDFELNPKDSRKQFCAEVASSVYADSGVPLWEGLTSMSSRGLTRWLAALGVRYFETHGPSDLEYDPKLRVVAEWRDPETLFQAHVDNAVIDVLLEGAEAGEEMEYAWPWLPLSRLAKAYSVGLNLMGRKGPIPEGMSATVALRVRWLSQRHAAIKTRTLELAKQFSEVNGYAAPYWELVKLGRQAKSLE